METRSQCHKQSKENSGMKNSDWLKIVMGLGTANQSPIFQHIA